MASAVTHLKKIVFFMAIYKNSLGKVGERVLLQAILCFFFCLLLQSTFWQNTASSARRIWRSTKGLLKR